jgi:hypothetical protein
LLRRSPHALSLYQTGLQGFRASGPRKPSEWFPGDSPGLRLLFRGCPSTEPLPWNPWFSRDPTYGPYRTTTSSASLEVLTPSAFSPPRAAA